MSQLLNPSNTAQMLCISELTLRKWRWEGNGPSFIKVGRKVAYRLEDIQEWVEKRVRRSTSDTGRII